MGHYLSEFYSVPPPKTICWKSKNLKHKWTNDPYYRSHDKKYDKDYIAITPAERPGQYVIPHLLWCRHCYLHHQP